MDPLKSFVPYFRHSGESRPPRADSYFKQFWTPAFAGVTAFLSFYEIIIFLKKNF
jgi:hypothetical protein